MRAITAFWKWWPTVVAKIEAATRTGKWQRLDADIAAHVAAIDADMYWEITEGLEADNAMTLSANGNAKLRKKAEAWLKAAPKRSKAWEFHASRQRRPDTILEFGGKTLKTKDAWVEGIADPGDGRFGVMLYHPAFAKLKKGDRESAAVLLLDGALGEDDLERWIAGISVKTKKTPFATRLGQFVADIDALNRT